MIGLRRQLVDYVLTLSLVLEDDQKVALVGEIQLESVVSTVSHNEDLRHIPEQECSFVILYNLIVRPDVSVDLTSVLTTYHR